MVTQTDCVLRVVRTVIWIAVLLLFGEIECITGNVLQWFINVFLLCLLSPSGFEGSFVYLFLVNSCLSYVVSLFSLEFSGWSGAKRPYNPLALEWDLPVSNYFLKLKQHSQLTLKSQSAVNLSGNVGSVQGYSSHLGSVMFFTLCVTFSFSISYLYTSHLNRWLVPKCILCTTSAFWICCVDLKSHCAFCSQWDGWK